MAAKEKNKCSRTKFSGAKNDRFCERGKGFQREEEVKYCCDGRALARNLFCVNCPKGDLLLKALLIVLELLECKGGKGGESSIRWGSSR